MITMKLQDQDLKEPYKIGRFLASPEDGEEVVISGLSGIYPDSENVYHFRDNLYNKVDMISSDDRRWASVHHEIPHRSGKIYNIEKFDNGFFGVHYRQAHSSDPVVRLFLERAIEAIFDAGINPTELKGTKTGVYVGSCFSETEKTWFYDKPLSQYFAVTGNERSMVPNRLSYYLKLVGPSFITDTACSSSLYALEQAYKDLRSGHCDMAIVGGTNICLHPFVSLQFARLGVLSLDGVCKVFDQRADGYARSEAVVAIFLQKANSARRIYCQVVHAKTNCDGFKPQSITYPSGVVQKHLLQEFYYECNINPSALSFLEAHGTGTAVGDPEELLAIDEVFCKNRRTPLLIGSVKSNIGHTEPSSGLCSITKAIFAMEYGLIPPNLNYLYPRQGIEGLKKGQLKVVTEKMPFQDDRGLIGVNSFGFGGGNAHILLRSHKKRKINKGLPIDDLPRLICVSGRTENAVNLILNDLSGRVLDEEYVRLYHQIFSKDICGHHYRSFTILSKSGEVKRSSPYFCSHKKPLYLAFTDFLISWSTISKELYQLPWFVASIQRVHNILLTKNINLIEIILGNKSQSNKIFNGIICSTAIQIALVDILKNLEINIEGHFGWRFGEFICGYFEEIFTLEQTVLSIYHLALTNHHSDKATSLKILSEIIGEPKSHSPKWLSRGNLNLNEHFLNSLTCQQIPHLVKNSIVLELGNEELNILKCHHHTLSSFDSNKNVFLNFLQILGSLYEFGQNFSLDRLYPKVEYPVSTATPMISPLIKWNHHEDWFVIRYGYDVQSEVNFGERSIRLSSKDEQWEYVKDHLIDGRNLFPASGYLVLIWETFSKMIGTLLTDKAVVFENCKFLRATTIPKDSTKIELITMVQKGSGNFEVIENDAVVVSGTVRIFKQGVKEQIKLPLESPDAGPFLKTKDIYKELRLRGYNYKGTFKKLVECDASIKKALITWDSNWVTFLDNMLQIKILQADTRNLYVPTGIKRLTIDGKKHLAFVQSLGEEPNLPVYLYKETDIIRCGGIEIRGLSASPIVRRKPRGEPVLEKYVFVPNEANLTVQNSVRVIMQMILENLPGYKIKTIEVIDDTSTEEPISSIIYNVLGDLPLIQPSISVFTKKDLKIPNVIVEDKKLITETDCTLVIGYNLLQTIMTLNQAFAATKENAFVLSRESLDFDFQCINFPGIDILAIHTLNTEKFYLIRRSVELKRPTVIDISDTNEEFVWLPILQKAVKSDPNVIVVAQNEPLSGILGLVNCIRREPGCTHVKTVFTFGETPVFDLNDSFYSKHIKKNFAINVYKDSRWGTYRHLLLNNNVLIEKEHCFGNTLVRGDFSSLKWLEGSLTQDVVVPPEKDLIYVYYSALNFRDVMSASGRINADIIVKDRTQLDFTHGFEFAGRTKRGKRVMGIVNGALSTLLLADRYLLWPCPDSWTLEEASTVPVVYSTVLFALIVNCEIKKKQSILIHSGSGGVGQAAIRLALHHGLTVYTTVGTIEKREFLKKQFPQLKDSHIGNSRDTSFEQMILSQTRGRGVDVVLNSLAEEKLLASVRCLAHGGHFLEIGKFDLANNNSLGLMLLKKGASFRGIMVDAVFHLDPKNKLRIKNLMIEGISNGSIKPLPRTTFKMEEIERAFRYMASGKHIGKILIQIRQEENNKNIMPLLKLFKVIPRFTCDPDQVHIIIGGLGGLGLELADWLVLRGARKLVLTSRKGLKTGYQAYRIKIWSTYGTHIHISTADITSKKGCLKLIEEAKSLGTIQSIFNLAVVLKDGIFENQTVDNFRECLAPKAFATKHLDEITRELCPQLRDFVIFSSVSCGRGNAGQTNYGMANSIMERICEKRKQDGYPATAIEWGAVGDVGLVAEMQEEHTEMEIGGTLQQRISNCLQVLDTLLVQNDAIVCSMVVAEKRGGAGGADNIVDTVANILGIRDLKTVSLHVALSELGMDSMTAVEIKQTLEREYEVFLTPHDIRGLTFSKLTEIQEERVSEEVSTKKDKSLEGIEMILRQMNDEETSKIPRMRLKSLIEEKVPGPTIIMFSGIEGVAKVVAPLASNLNGHVHCVQFLYENQCETIREMAEELLPIIDDLISKNQPFNIIGYSFGVVVALEVVAILEAKGYRGNFFAIDGSPNMSFKLLQNSLKIESEAEFQTAFLTQLMSLHMPYEIVLKEKQNLLNSKSLEDRLDIGEKILPKDTPHSISYLRLFSTALYKRLKALIAYKISYPKIKSKVKLFKPEIATVSGLEDDYKMGEICENSVDVRVFKGNHATILENLEMAEAINKIVGTSVHFTKEVMLSDDVGRSKLLDLEIKHI